MENNRDPACVLWVRVSLILSLVLQAEAVFGLYKHPVPSSRILAVHMQYVLPCESQCYTVLSHHKCYLPLLENTKSILLMAPPISLYVAVITIFSKSPQLQMLSHVLIILALGQLISTQVLSFVPKGPFSQLFQAHQLTQVGQPKCGQHLHSLGFQVMQW